MRRIKFFILAIFALAALASNCSKPEAWEMSRWYTQYSRYRDDEIRAFSLYVSTLDEDKLSKICDYYYEKYKDPDRYLRVDIYDDRSFTPDYSDGVNITKYQDEHRIVNFYYNPFTDQKTLDFLR